MTSVPKVSFLRCDSYERDLEEKIRELLLPLGGAKAFLSRGPNVLIKPNLLTDRDPDKAVTTHPALVRAVIRVFKAAGASVCVADSPASAVKIEKVFEKSGFARLCREEQVPLLNVEKAGAVTFQEKDISFSIAKPFLDANLLINMPKVKTHSMTMLTAGVKNLYGTIPGYQKMHLHKMHPKPPEFGRLIAHIYTRVAPRLTIADAIVGMQGDGPTAGTPAQLGFLAASDSAAALDFALCRILKIKPRAVPYLAELYRRSPDVAKWESAGVSPDDLVPASFELPSTLRARLIPRWLVRLLEPFVWIRPQFNDSCIQCGRCAESCPVNAIKIPKGRKPELSPELCIACCCCHEICPAKAITMGQSPFLNFIRKGRMP
jgi:uncharacterized protein (DUF362 family)/Pyruvate/2-oxoacid:ferredoxin oxidoreductase delta subunit